jgi:hypothetical protein
MNMRRFPTVNNPDEMTIIDTANITAVRRFYANLGSPEILTQVLSPTVRWEIVPGFPYGGVYLGVNAVFQDFFGRVLQVFEEWRTEMSELFRRERNEETNVAVPSRVDASHRALI